MFINSFSRRILTFIATLRRKVGLLLLVGIYEHLRGKRKLHMTTHIMDKQGGSTLNGSNLTSPF